MFGWTPLLAVRLMFAAAMVALFVIDLEHQLLPDAITLPGIVVGLVASLFLPPGFVDALIGVVAGGGFLWLVGEAYYRYAGQEGMGGGDVKMLAMIGAFLGWKLDSDHADPVVVSRLDRRPGDRRAQIRRHEVGAALRHLPRRSRLLCVVVGGAHS